MKSLTYIGLIGAGTVGAVLMVTEQSAPRIAPQPANAAINQEQMEATDYVAVTAGGRVQASESETNTTPSRNRSLTAGAEATKPRLGVAHDPMLVMALGDFSEEEIAAYNELHIIPFNPAVDQECEETLDPQLFNETIVHCTTVRAFPDHPYAQLDTDALEQLAITDATAALFLGRRTNHEEARIGWYLRAAALSEKPGELMALAERRYNQPFTLEQVDNKLVNVAQPENLIKRLALEEVAARMGDPRAHPEKWRTFLNSITDTEPGKMIRQAEKLAQEYLNQMADIQRDVSGSNSIQEMINNAT